MPWNWELSDALLCYASQLILNFVLRYLLLIVVLLTISGVYVRVPTFNLPMRSVTNCSTLCYLVSMVAGRSEVDAKVLSERDKQITALSKKVKSLVSFLFFENSWYLFCFWSILFMSSLLSKNMLRCSAIVWRIRGLKESVLSLESNIAISGRDFRFIQNLNTKHRYWS